MSDATKDQFSNYQIRPRFQFESPYSIEQLTTKLVAGLKEENAPCLGQVIENHATLYLPVEEQHYWSPQLNLTLEKSPIGTLVRGFYGPRPAVWTMFVFFYALVAFAMMVVVIIGISNLMLDKLSSILWLLPILVLIFLTLYLVSFYGQKMGRNQMVTLHKFMEYNWNQERGELAQ